MCINDLHFRQNTKNLPKSTFLQFSSDITLIFSGKYGFVTFCYLLPFNFLPVLLPSCYYIGKVPWLVSRKTPSNGFRRHLEFFQASPQGMVIQGMFTAPCQKIILSRCACCTPCLTSSARVLIFTGVHPSEQNIGWGTPRWMKHFYICWGRNHNLIYHWGTPWPSKTCKIDWGVSIRNEIVLECLRWYSTGWWYSWGDEFFMNFLQKPLRCTPVCSGQGSESGCLLKVRKK